MCDKYGLKHLGKIPLDPSVGASSDKGASIAEIYPESPASIAYVDIVNRKCLSYNVFSNNEYLIKKF